AHSPSLAPVALEMSKSMSLHPADVAGAPLNPVLRCVGSWISRIQSRLERLPNPLRVVRMQPLRNYVFDGYIARRSVENLLRASVTRDHATKRIILPPPELGCVESQLQTLFAGAQRMLRSLALIDVLDHSEVAHGVAGFVADEVRSRVRPNRGSVFA